ncbi:FHA domain-containing protein [Microcoleus sp. FACHB-672]|uniref:FHA domain-containing protein n=1 Tax=Microcoleus sp. FACHB-672 TaxID=2692825 RepID=UPI001684D7E1|nr:FHA domain-containing protein [Microcoleus sp. FACHB-672]MBD2042437.1 FHA domain-containing protein [Microcoleus sp. FACHB-672]
MNQLILEWSEAGQPRSQTIQDQQPSKHPGTVRIGRDPSRCDIVLTHPTVSGLHIEIFFNRQQNNFSLRNLRDTNPPAVDGHRLSVGELPLHPDSRILLGEVELNVVAVSVATSGVAPTVIASPLAAIPAFPSPGKPVKPAISPTVPPNANYGLECPCCNRISPYERLDLGCPWCGTSLAAAVSVVMPPGT